MSLNKLELKLRVEAKINEIKAQLGTLAADTTADAQKRKQQLEAKLKDAGISDVHAPPPMTTLDV